ncbi:MAG: aminopeptidase N [Pseudomonadota bacterium]
MSQAVFLKDYTPPAYLVDAVHLTFRLHPSRTRVISRIEFRPNPDTGQRDFRLHGIGLERIRTEIDGHEVAVSETDDGITCSAPDAPFTWVSEVEINPEANTALEGLYMSKGMYCSQCEAEGFRKITYYPDRPDVMAPFSVRIEGDPGVLLSNGNLVERGDGWAEWHDPWPKPSYLFALVAGDLVSQSAQFRTASGRAVDLNVWVRPGDETRCDYALDALRRAMRWDEEVYGREYDLDVFNIVAVDDFNMGAMENKGLNVFNSKYVLASPETATDRDFELIESIVAHEYFHNWTGNRITCRDWFQLCLKEGLTVFRDQEFSGDQRSHPVKRIEDVLQLRARQFREDNGPLAHPVRPASYIEINNFYTATVYEKGAELIGMLKTLVGEPGYRAALDLYFERHDGDAATIDDWLQVFEDATGRDLSQFALWYAQSGTPRLKVWDTFEDGTYTLHFAQTTHATPGQPEKKPHVIPIAVGLLAPDGAEMRPTEVLEMTEAQQSFSFSGLSVKPVPSILRNFSAPVILERESSAEERAFLLAHDTDPFSRFEAGRQLAKDVLSAMVTRDGAPGPDYLDAMERVLRDGSLDPAFRALALRLPGEDDMAQSLFDAGVTPDPSAIHAARERLADGLARQFETLWPRTLEEMTLPGPYTPDPKAAGCRQLRQVALGYLSRLDGGEKAKSEFRDASNMTDEIHALGCLIRHGQGAEAVEQFHRRWSHDRLVMDKWFSVQLIQTRPTIAAAEANRLTKHSDFDWKNPNRFRAVIGGLVGNTAGFHDPSGDAYQFVADWLIRLDPVNPQTAARMTTVFETWGRYDADRQGLIREALERVAASPGLSRDTGEMVGRILAH